jgi:hypothetical protein
MIDVIARLDRAIQYSSRWLPDRPVEPGDDMPRPGEVL